MIAKLSTTINKFYSTKVWYFTENILVVGLLFYCIKALTDYDNVYYQTWKNEAAAKAILSFTIIVFIIRKVKLLNWQSLIATLLFSSIVIERFHFWKDAPDILNAVKPQLAAEWFSLMIIIDMLLYKKCSNVFKPNNYLLYLYIALSIGMLIRRHDRMDPLVLIFPMFLFALIKMDEKKERWFACRFMDAWFISFVYFVIKSLRENPYAGYHYYGSFLNIGQFGIFMVCCFTVAIAAIYYSNINYGRMSFSFFISIVWLFGVSYMLFIIDTRTIIAGILSCFITIYLFIRQDTTKRTIICRLVILLFIIIILFIAATYLFIKCETISIDWLINNQHGILSPIVAIIFRFRYMYEASRNQSLGQQIFEIIDAASSWRLSIIAKYSESFNFDGNSTLGVLVEKYDYWAYTAHNTYVQFLIEYGYISFFEMIIFVICALAKTIKAFLQKKQSIFPILSILWLASMIGVWIGESNTFFFPISFFGYMFTSRTLIQDDK